MTKQEQIEEIGKSMCEEFHSENCGNYCECANEYIAEKLYNAGYRKTFTSELVSDTQKAFKEGYRKGFDDREEEFKIIIKRNEELLKENARLESEKREYEKPIDKFIKDREAKAVKEFAEKLKDKLQNFIYDNADYDGKVDSGILYVDVIGVTAKNGDIVSFGLIDELLKEYEK